MTDVSSTDSSFVCLLWLFFFFFTNNWSKWSQYKFYGISQFGQMGQAKAWTSNQWLLTRTLSMNNFTLYLYYMTCTDIGWILRKKSGAFVHIISNYRNQELNFVCLINLYTIKSTSWENKLDSQIPKPWIFFSQIMCTLHPPYLKSQEHNGRQPMAMYKTTPEGQDDKSPWHLQFSHPQKTLHSCKTVE